MNIQEFSSSLITTPEEGKSIINILIGMSPSGKNVLDALLGLYESYPDSVKANKKVFGPTFYKLFNNYEMKEKHLTYYREFSKIWGPAELAAIKIKYSELLKNEEKQSFKNSREFAKALQKINGRASPDAAFQFFEDNLEILAPIIKKSSNKFIDNLSEFHCWENLISSNYLEFKNLCQKLNIDFLSVLKKEYVESFYGAKYLITNVNDSAIIDFFEDIKNDLNFFGNSGFFANRHEKEKIEKQYQINILESLISLLSDGKNSSFCYLMKNYPTQISHCMDAYFHEQEHVNILDSTHWEKIISNMEKVSERYNSKEFFSKYEIANFKAKINNNFKIIDTILLENDLALNIDVKNKRMKI